MKKTHTDTQAYQNQQNGPSFQTKKQKKNHPLGIMLYEQTKQAPGFLFEWMLNDDQLGAIIIIIITIHDIITKTKKMTRKSNQQHITALCLYNNHRINKRIIIFIFFVSTI